jgi:hypothetical protein
MVVIIVVTARVARGSFGGFAEFPWTFLAAGTAALFLRFLLLLGLTGGYQVIAAALGNFAWATYNWFCGIVTKEYKPPKWEWPTRLASRPSSLIYRADKQWFSLLVLGIVAQLVIVGASGGMAASPFAQLLIATFILGEFRSPTSAAIWWLFAFGIAAAFTAHAVFLGLERVDPSAWKDVAFPARYFIAPGVLVSFASTAVYWVTFMAEASRAGDAAPKP